MIFINRAQNKSIVINNRFKCGHNCKEVDAIRRSTGKLDGSIADMRPAASAQEQEDIGIALANELAMKQLREGTASSQVITHFLKLGSSKERLEKEILEQQSKLMAAKTEALQRERDLNEIMVEAISAMKRYSGNADEEDVFE